MIQQPTVSQPARFLLKTEPPGRRGEPSHVTGWRDEPATIVVYGIPNCDTVRKARAWLDARHVPYRFHDLRKTGIPADRLDAWLAHCGWERLLNRQGATWRKLDAAAQGRVSNAIRAKGLMQAQPAIIKRPVVEWGDRVTVGFDPAAWTLLTRR